MASSDPPAKAATNTGLSTSPNGRDDSALNSSAGSAIITT
jgi:hypothetical protein